MCRSMILAVWLVALAAGCGGENCEFCKMTRGATGGGGQAPEAGELGGACLADGTCGEGLACLEGTCMPALADETLLMFHNNRGPMCLAALDWLETAKSEYPTLVIEEHLTYEAGEMELLGQLEEQFQTSEGVSTSFGYLPILFFREQAFSGFNDEIAEALEDLLTSVAESSP
jgi:hypothetical protein